MDVLIGVFGRGIWRSKSTVYGRMCPRRRFGMCARVRVLCWIYGLLTQPVNDVWIVVCGGVLQSCYLCLLRSICNTLIASNSPSKSRCVSLLEYLDLERHVSLKIVSSTQPIACKSIIIRRAPRRRNLEPQSIHTTHPTRRLQFQNTHTINVGVKGAGVPRSVDTAGAAVVR
jgi:hypothetical protein